MCRLSITHTHNKYSIIRVVSSAIYLKYEVLTIYSIYITIRVVSSRVAEVAREHGWHPPKSLDWDKNFKPEHTLFCRELRLVAIYALFGHNFRFLWSIFVVLFAASLIGPWSDVSLPVPLTHPPLNWKTR